MLPASEIETYVPFTREIARWVARKSYNLTEDDLTGPAFLALMDAVRRFDPTKGIKFTTYARKRIKGGIIDQLRTEFHTKRQNRPGFTSLSDPFLSEDPVLVSHYTADPAKTIEIKDLVHYILNQLVPQQALVLYLYYAEGKTAKEIGILLDLTESRICQIKKAALDSFHHYYKLANVG